MKPRMLRRAGTVALAFVAVVAATIVAAPQAAVACWCANGGLEQRIEEAEAVAVIETTTQADDSAMPNTRNARIVEVFKGNPPEAILVAGGPVDSSCGNFELTDGMVMGVIINGATASVGPCSSAISPETLEALFSAIEQPNVADGAAFIVGLERPGARIALLDASGSVIAHGDERRTVRQVAACPAGDVFVSVVVDDARGRGGSLVVRDVGSLEIVSERQAAVPDSGVQALECHSDDGGVVSYLVPRLRNRAGRERYPERAESVVHLWNGDAHRAFRAGAATELLVDAANDAGYVIDGQGRGAIERWQLSTGSRTARFDMDGLDVRALVTDPTDGSVVGFAGKIGTKRAFMIRIGSDAEVIELEEGRRPVAARVVGGQYITLGRGRGATIFIQRRLLDGTLVDEVGTGLSGPVPVVASVDPLIYTVSGHLRTSASDLFPATDVALDVNAFVDPRWRRIESIASLPPASATLALTPPSIPPRFERAHGPSSETAAPSESPTTSSPEIRATTPDTTTIATIGTGGGPEAAETETNGETQPPRALIAIAIASTIILSALLLLRRRRSRTG